MHVDTSVLCFLQILQGAFGLMRTLWSGTGRETRGYLFNTQILLLLPLLLLQPTERRRDRTDPWTSPSPGFVQIEGESGVSSAVLTQESLLRKPCLDRDGARTPSNYTVADAVMSLFKKLQAETSCPQPLEVAAVLCEKRPCLSLPHE